MTRASIARQLRRARKLAGMSKTEAARLAGVSRQAVQSWESGRNTPAADTYLRLLKLYGAHDEPTDPPADPPAVVAPDLQGNGRAA